MIIHGLTPQIGIHHKSNTNLNNLADDFIEIYRPLVDYCIYTELIDETELNNDVKKTLISILDLDLWFGKKIVTVRTSIGLFIQQYCTYLIDGLSIADMKEVTYEL